MAVNSGNVRDGWLAPPATFGFDPAQFGDWRSDQASAIRAVLESSHRFTGLVLPTGAGKSLVALTIARLTGWRTVYLTSTKALQDQIQRDFGRLVTLVKGQAAYPCLGLAPTGTFADWNPERRALTCDHGPCHVGKLCHERDRCWYFGAVSAASTAPLVVTNYACWLAHRLYGLGLGGRTDCLILDEAHAAPDELASALKIEIKLRDLDPTERWPAVDNTPARWDALKDWAASLLGPIDLALDSREPTSHAEVLNHGRLKRLSRALSRILSADPDITLVRETGMNAWAGLELEPVWAATHNGLLWDGVAHVVAMSATVRPKTLELLGVGLPQTTWYESLGDFPVGRRPVLVCPPMKGPNAYVRVDHRWTAEDETLWVSQIDNILRSRPDVKGIIHTVSYARRNRILQKSQYVDRFLTHDRDDTAGQVERFKRSTGPVVLLSPSVTTGYDFPHDECRFQIVGKLPFPDGRDPITDRRTVLDPDYPPYVAMQELVQMVGRGMRANTDWCETFVIDGHAHWFLRKFRSFAPKWFLQAVRYSDSLPARLECR